MIDVNGILGGDIAIGRQLQNLAQDIRLACNDLDANDKDFIIGLVGPDLFPLPHLVQGMRTTIQTAGYPITQERGNLMNKLTRRRFSVAVGSMLAAGVMLHSGISVAAAKSDDELSRKLVEIERRLGARLGATIRDTETGHQWAHRSDERFPMTSTFKAFACAGILARVDAGKEDLNRRIAFEKKDLVTYSPVTETRVGGEGMRISEICEAAMSMSDNSAGNMVLDVLGGPVGFTQFMRSIGDNVTRLDRKETDLNEATPGDPRDTTTPNAIAKSLHDLVLGDALSLNSHRQLEDWLVGNRVGGPLLRAGLPKTWRIGDRTGAGGYGSRSIVAVVWPPQRKPVVVAIYITATEASMDVRNAAIAELGRTLADMLMK